MKKLFFVLLASSAMLTACAQKMDASKVPAVVRTSFQKTYPSTDAKWEKEAGNYEANFKYNDTKMSVLITPGGTIKETEVDIKESDLPAAVASYIKEHYKGKTIKESSKITTADGTVTYEAEIEGKDLMFDSNGKFIKTEKD